jgi:hypothetical protein
VELEGGIVGLEDLGGGVDCADGRIVLGEDGGDAAAPDISAGAEVSEDVGGGPLVRDGAGAQLGWCQVGGEGGEALGGGGEQGQDLLDREW